jgi:hypothetical protein
MVHRDEFEKSFLYEKVDIGLASFLMNNEGLAFYLTIIQ